MKDDKLYLLHISESWIGSMATSQRVRSSS